MVQSPHSPSPPDYSSKWASRISFDRYNLIHIPLIRQLYGVKLYFQGMYFQFGTQKVKWEGVINMEIVSLIPYTGAENLRLFIHFSS